MAPAPVPNPSLTKDKNQPSVSTLPRYLLHTHSHNCHLFSLWCGQTAQAGVTPPGHSLQKQGLDSIAELNWPGVMLETLSPMPLADVGPI